MAQQQVNNTDNIPSLAPESLQAWSKWLQENHDKEDRLWLIYHKKGSGKPMLPYSDVVDEALCYGWIDSKAQKIDANSYRQYFCRRKPDSVWSKVNKAKVEKLLQQGKMQPSGIRMIEVAKANGMWHILDEAEALMIPADLQKALNYAQDARNFFMQLSRTDKRNLLQWLVLAKKKETRAQRITAIVQQALQGKKPKGF